MIVVTGASDGLGYEIAKLLQANGKRVVNISRRSSDVAAENILVDLSTEDGVKSAAAGIIGYKEPIEAIVHNAGVLTLQPLGDISYAEIERTFHINTYAPLFLTSLLAKRIKQDSTDIVFIDSTAGLYPYVGQSVYNASKRAVHGFMEDLREEHKDLPSRIIGIYPGMLDTDMVQKIPGVAMPKSKHPAISPIDIANLVMTAVSMPKHIELGQVVINRKKIKR